MPLHSIDSGISGTRGSLHTIESGFRVFAAAGGGFTGLLDTYPNAAFAYSFRKLRAAYAGSAVRIRESGGNTESNIGFTVGGDFDSAAAASFIGANSGFIVTWYDQSGNGYNATQATSGNQPGYSATGVNGRPACDFVGGSSQNLSTASGAIASASLPSASCFVVATIDNAGDAFGGIVSLKDPNHAGANDYDAASSWAALTRENTNQTVLTTEQGVNAGPSSVTYGVAFLATTLLVGGANNFKIFVNGSAGTPATVGVTPTLGSSGNTLTANLGARILSGGISNYSDGLRSEVVLWLTDQTANL